MKHISFHVKSLTLRQSVSICGFLVLFLLVVSCKPEIKPSGSTGHIHMMDDTLINYNRQIVNSEAQEIDDYIARHQWKMKRTATGLRYMIFSSGNSRKSRINSKVTFKYSISLLTGVPVYSSDLLGPRTILVGATQGESGLQEGLLLMGNNDHAKLIIPSHLAFGLLGDMNKIPAQAVLVYDIEIVSVLP